MPKSFGITQTSPCTRLIDHLRSYVVNRIINCDETSEINSIIKVSRASKMFWHDRWNVPYCYITFSKVPPLNRLSSDRAKGDTFVAWHIQPIGCRLFLFRRQTKTLLSVNNDLVSQIRVRCEPISKMHLYNRIQKHVQTNPLPANANACILNSTWLITAQVTTCIWQRINNFN